MIPGNGIIQTLSDRMIARVVQQMPISYNERMHRCMSNCIHYFVPNTAMGDLEAMSLAVLNASAVIVQMSVWD